jgi:hypothetical protein
MIFSASNSRSFMLRQSVTFVICIAASGRMLLQWRRLDDYDRARVWKHYGSFCGLMCCGSCVGALCYAAHAQYLANFYLSEWPSDKDVMKYIDANENYSRVRVLFSSRETSTRAFLHRFAAPQNPRRQCVGTQRITYFTPSPSAVSCSRNFWSSAAFWSSFDRRLRQHRAPPLVAR